MPASRPPGFRRRAVEPARRNKPTAQTARDLGIAESCRPSGMARAGVGEGRSASSAAFVLEMTLPAIAVSVIGAAATGGRTPGTKVIQRVLPADQEGTAADRAFPEE